MISLVYPKRPDRVAKAIGLLIVSLAVIVLAGAALGNETLVRVVPHWPGMARLTALTLILSGVSLWCLAHALPTHTTDSNRSGKSSRALIVGRIAAALVAVIGFSRNCLWIGGATDGSLDALWLPLPESIVASGSLPRMALATSISFWCLGCAMLIASRRRFSGIFQLFVMMAGGIGLLSLSRYLYGGAPLIPNAQMAIHTTLALLFVCAGTMCLRPDGGMMALLLSDTEGGKMARWLLPPALVGPLLVGWLRLWGQRAGWYETEAGLSLFAISNVVFFCTLILMTGVLLHRGDLERRKVEETLRESQALYHSLVEQMPVGVFRKDEQGRFVFVNSWFCNLSGSKPKHFLGLTSVESLRALKADSIAMLDLEKTESLAASGIEHHDQIMRTGQRIELDEERFLADGRRRYLHVVKSPIYDAEGRIAGSQGTLIDVTERKLAEEEVRHLNADLEQRVAKRTAELEAVNKELEAFSYSVSHDLRAPLRAVNGFAIMALEDFGDGLPPEGRRQLKKICDGSERMGQLIDDLLTFARLSRQPVNQQDMNTGRLVQDVLTELQSQQEGRSIDLHIGDLPACRGDIALLKQVWINLLSNAFKYTRGKDPAVVEVGYAHDGNADIYFVRDNGAGFDMQYANKLFGVFQRLHRAEEFEGTGVGLAIVQRVIHRHGGRVWATAAPGKGATFYFTLGN